ncbi:MAG: leucine-rich repeat protein, partial [Lachnospiraceae bacterium]|nr:leucine-rich repeat protein [Lachnospiraceae bacterium]
NNMITYIADRAFAGVNNVSEIKIGDIMVSIGQSAFEQADIHSVSIGNATTIGDRAFYGCKNLASVTFTSTAPTSVIGVEAFYGSGLNTKLELPRHISEIGHGAFAYCLDLSEVQFFDNGDDCTIDEYAFYGDTRLTKVDFARVVFKKIGKCAFAIAAPSGDTMIDFHFPSEGLETMDDYILANRRSLQNVYIDNYTKKIPDNTFYNCFGLKSAVFDPDKCGAASFGTNLFKDVTEDDFCVYGPELYANQPANPRTSTWDAVRTDGKGIPYVYEKDGKKYYEMALESDGTRYRYAASEDGTLISCALITRDPGLIDLVIPEKIGNIQIKSIGAGCFNEADPTNPLRNVIRSITIKNNSVSTIGDGVFRDLPKLKKVRIGDSVTSIGANAFAGCSILEDVYFTKPAAGYAALKIGTDAFVTKGSKLTFHGDIVEGYAPFEWATDMSNLLRDPDKPNLPPVNVCYQSLWDSEQGAHLTVMPDQKTGEVTLLDYPKFKDLENIDRDVELQDFCADMEEYYYYTIYDADNGNNNEMRQEFADIFDAYRTGKSEVTLADGEIIRGYENMEAAMNERYGPWINPVYCSGAWLDYRSQSGGADTSRGNIVDSLFAPMVVEAAYSAYDDGDGNPIPYFEKYPYNFMDNYQSWLKDPDSYNRLNDYQQVPQKVWDFINATQDIYVPAGVDSIDVISYMKENSDNYNTYIKDRPVNTMYTTTLNGAQPGLFSGYYKDYEEDDNDDRETAVKGNDTIKSVTLTAVKELPDYAFDNCEQLTRVEMPAVTKVGKLPFRDCANIINLVGSPDYPAERGILYERHKDADGNDRYRIIECLLSRGRENSGNEELTISTISSATDSLLPFLCETCDTDKDGSNVLPAIAEGAFEGCKYISIVDLSNANNLKTIPKDAFKDCTRLNQVMLPGSVNKIADTAFARTDDTVNAAHATVTIYGREVDIADSAFTPRGDFTIYSYEDSAAERYAKRFQIQFYPLNAYRVWFYDYDGTPLGDVMTVDKGFRFTDEDIPSAAKVVEEKNHRPGYEFVGWMSNTGKTPSDGIENDMTVFVAQYKSDGTLVDGKCSVQFVHGRTGQVFSGRGADENDRYLIVPGTSFADPLNGDLPTPVPSPNPTEDGYVFLNEFRTDQGEVWTPETVINRNMTVLALFGQAGDGNTSGGSTSSGSTSGGSTSGGSTTSSRGSSNSSNRSSSSSSSSTSSSSTSSSSTSTTSTTSGAGQYTVFVDGGNGSGSYTPGTIVIISAYVPAEGMVFSNWTTDSNGVTLASTTMSTTTFTMPANNVTVKANYVAGTAPGPVATNSNGNGSTTNDNGNTRVDIEKPGISNRDLATAVTNGSTDNFIVKISETDEATRAVAAALTNKYGTLDNILYYAMDITLWDSTGTHQITGDQLNGISVDITIPIPDSLVAYGGNNKAGAVINNDQLESLNENFTTINGVPCIRFRATHFSPYTIYVDTGNLVEGMLDVTPKTGDPIHPKWFLSLGLACLSIILFMKKDKKVAAKATVKA